MNRTGSAIVTICLYFTLACCPAEAVQRAFVSAATGLDTNTAFSCDAIHPCRFFQAATTVVDPNGEVVVLNSGGYGAVSITQSISLIAPAGVYAGISVFPGATGVTITTPGVNAVLRGITINGQGGDTGIYMAGSNALTVENCLIANLAGTGIAVQGAASVRISDTTVRDSGFGGVILDDVQSATISHVTFSGNNHYGVAVRALTAISSTADISDSTMDDNVFGVYALAQLSSSVVVVSVSGSRMLRNSGDGIAALSAAAGSSAALTAVNNLLHKNQFNGISGYNAGTKILASGNTVTNSSIGFLNSGALFESTGNNALRGNGLDSSGSINTITTK